MHRDSDTTIIERNPPAKRRREFNFMPYCFIVIVIAVVVAMVALVGAANKVKSTGVARSEHPPIFSEPIVFVPDQPVFVKFRHVIFRVGKWEICRFTYEEGEPDNARESAHE